VACGRTHYIPFEGVAPAAHSEERVLRVGLPSSGGHYLFVVSRSSNYCNNNKTTPPTGADLSAEVMLRLLCGELLRLLALHLHWLRVGKVMGGLGGLLLDVGVQHCLVWR
jgi:hypothetical protein